MATKTLSAALAGAIALAGCAHTSAVVPMGKDSFMVSGWSGMVEPSGAVAEKANAYCEANGKHMIVRHVTDQQTGLGDMRDKLIFSCVTDSDPEYQRPNLRNDPAVVIDNR
jgi:hypothetical protein